AEPALLPRRLELLFRFRGQGPPDHELDLALAVRGDRDGPVEVVDLELPARGVKDERLLDRLDSFDVEAHVAGRREPERESRRYHASKSLHGRASLPDLAQAPLGALPDGLVQRLVPRHA